MDSTNSTKILDVCQVTPFTDSLESATEFSLPLTFFDTFMFKTFPGERIYFYELLESSPSFFNSTIVPRLKHSLSLTLTHFLPVTCSLEWPLESPKPLILHAPTDAVSLTVAESDADFHNLSAHTLRKMVDSHPLIPKLPASDSRAAIVALQVTLFPNQGFCIGISMHHSILDAKSASLFIKAWAHICKQTHKEQHPKLPLELTPVWDRTVINDPEGIDMVYLNNWLGIKWSDFGIPDPKSVKPLDAKIDPTLMLATMELSREDIMKIKKKVLSDLDNVPNKCDESETKSIHLSTLVLAYAYTVVCIVKAKKLEGSQKVHFGLAADCRARLDPPISENYLGNCVCNYSILVEAKALIEENGVGFAAERLSDVIKGLEKDALAGAKEKLAELIAASPGIGFVTGIAASPKFGCYGSDFGWGKPKKVEITSIRRTGAISMLESRDTSGGVEMGVAMNQQEMELFYSLFVDGLKQL